MENNVERSIAVWDSIVSDDNMQDKTPGQQLLHDSFKKQLEAKQAKLVQEKP